MDWTTAYIASCVIWATVMGLMAADWTRCWYQNRKYYASWYVRESLRKAGLGWLIFLSAPIWPLSALVLLGYCGRVLLRAAREDLRES